MGTGKAYQARNAQTGSRRKGGQSRGSVDKGVLLIRGRGPSEAKSLSPPSQVLVRIWFCLRIDFRREGQIRCEKSAKCHIGKHTILLDTKLLTRIQPFNVQPKNIRQHRPSLLPQLCMPRLPSLDAPTTDSGTNALNIPSTILVELGNL